MADYSTLVSAISDVGYWRWWSEQLPEVFQLEFGGVQIFTPPEDKTKPPSSLLALRFIRPSRVSFIRRNSDTDDLPLDWPHQLKAGKIDPFGVSYDQFALGNEALFAEVASQVTDETLHFSDAAGGKELRLAFWAGAAGMKIEAAGLRPVLMTGVVELPTIESLHRDWWSY